MFPTDILITYLVAIFLFVIAPGPGSILAIGRCLNQGRVAAALSSIAAGLSILALLRRT